MSDNESVNQSECNKKKQPDTSNYKYGYIPVCDTHQYPSEYIYKDQQFLDKIRYFMLTKKNQQGRISLHFAAEQGDKDFCTFIIEEAKILSKKCG